MEMTPAAEFNMHDGTLKHFVIVLCGKRLTSQRYWDEAEATAVCMRLRRQTGDMYTVEVA